MGDSSNSKKQEVTLRFSVVDIYPKWSRTFQKPQQEPVLGQTVINVRCPGINALLVLHSWYPSLMLLEG
ncbi:hypothetical protein HZH66_004935 [Vespula vulgaris]|uniref:Uncharacterized protein n=1 Tax=Vespula vulgaris TaxID=7454 RepID=A0A834K9H5_VESVU|nr:hypothetical protein HZH66_004935 [Vespula vulgaris]